MGKPSVVGCDSLDIDPLARQAHLADATIGEGDWVSIDGDQGAVYVGRRSIRRERPSVELAELDRWREAIHLECAAG
jgi:pyruvate, orthophosphate dikinase